MLLLILQTGSNCHNKGCPADTNLYLRSTSYPGGAVEQADIQTHIFSFLIVAAHLPGLAARCHALSQTSAQTTSSTGGDWRLSSRSTVFALRAQGYTPLRLLLCQADRCPVSTDVNGVGVVGDGRIDLNHCVINVCGWKVMGAQRARKHLQLARQSL